MDALVKFPTRFSCQGIDSDITKRLALGFSSSKRPCNLHLGKMQIQQKNNVLKKSWDHNRISAIPSKKDPKSRQNSFSPAETVEQFYTCINEKNIQQLGECISEDACFDDYAFTKPFKGKKVCILTIFLILK